MKNVTFAGLDTAADLQVVFDNSRIDGQKFEEARRIKVGQRIEANVETEYNDKYTPPIRLIVHDFDVLQSDLIVARRSEINREQAQSKIDLAAIARSTANFLTSLGWTEAVPHTISTNLDQTMDPLQVLFPGLGAETALLVSPIPELVEISQVTGIRSLFSVSRLYSRAIRDGFTSPESLAVVAVRIMGSDDYDFDPIFIQDLIKSSLQPVKNRLSERGREWLEDVWEKRRSTTIGSMREVLSPVHEIIREKEYVAFRSLWPHPIALVEGHVRTLSDGTLHCITLHCERVLHLVSGAHYRRLQEGPRLV